MSIIKSYEQYHLSMSVIITHDNIKVPTKYMEITFIFIGNKIQILMMAL